MSLSNKVSSKIELIDATTAAKMINNVHPLQAGRHIHSTIESYAKQMLHGQWDENVLQPIGVDTDNALINGYHRLNGLLLANETDFQKSEGVTKHRHIKIMFLIVRGVDPDSFGNWDSGVARTLGYKMGMTPDHASIISSIINLALYPARYGKVTRDQAELTDSVFGDPIRSMCDNISQSRRARVTTVSVRVGLLFAVMANPKNKDQIYAAYNNLVRMDFTEAPRSMSSLHKRLLEERHANIEQVVLAYDAFTPSKFDNKLILIKDYKSKLEEIRNKFLNDLAAAIS
jgi:hypothetical protein